MKNASQVESENVIKISFGDRNLSQDIPNEVSHPASKRYPESLDDSLEVGSQELDPLEELLIEGSELNDFDFEDEEENYIHAHEKPFQYGASYADSSQDLASAAIERLLRLKEDAKRIRYYLDEMNID